MASSLPPEGPPPWREAALERVLRVASVVMPIGAVVAALTLSSSGKAIDLPAASLLGVAGIVVALRWLPQLGFEARAAGVIVALQIICVTVLATTGPRPGAALSTGIAAVLAAILFRARTMMLVLSITVVLHLALGLLAQDGLLVLRSADIDPTQLRNWIRPASTTVLLSGVLAALVAYVVKQLETSERALRTLYQQVSQLHGKLDAAKELGERTLSHGLQEEMSQTLTALKLRLQLWRGSNAVVSAKELDEALALVDDLLSRARSLSLGLRPPLLDDLGLEPAVRAFVESKARERGLDANMETSGLEDRLPIELETACFRIVEDAVTSAAHRVHAQHILVTLRRANHQLRIRVQNDGAFEAELAQDDHVDLVGVRERVRMLGGELSVSSPDAGLRGLRIEVTLPLDQRLPAATAE
jgi:signal transduction histidine kinase